MAADPATQRSGAGEARAAARAQGPSWKVDPAPDGRGKPPEKPPMLPFSWRRFVVILAVLLALNYLFVAIFAPAEERKQISYTPNFIQQVEKGNVKEISSKGETLTGDYKKKVDGRRALQDRGARPSPTPTSWPSCCRTTTCA